MTTMIRGSGMAPGLPKNVATMRCSEALTACRPSVANNGESGSGISSTMLLRIATYAPVGRCHSSGGPAPAGGSAVTGRAWRMAKRPLARAHSTSIGVPYRALDAGSQPCQLPCGLVVEDRRTAQVIGHLFDVCAAVAADRHQRLVAGLPGHDPAPVLVHDHGVGRDRAADDALTQAPRRAHHDLAAPAGERMCREQYASSLRRDQYLEPRRRARRARIRCPARAR